MKINAKKTNSASGNAIQASYFFLEFRKLIYLPRILQRKFLIWSQLNANEWPKEFWPIISLNQSAAPAAWELILSM